MRNAILVSFLAVVAVFLVRSVRATAVPSVGNAAPDFTLASQDGKPITLSQYRGKWVVLYLYPQGASLGDSAETHNFLRDDAKYAAANAIVLGVQPSASQPQPADESANFQLLADPAGAVAGVYGPVENFNMGTKAARSNFLIDPQGRIADEWVGVDPTHHSDETLRKLSSAQ